MAYTLSVLHDPAPQGALDWRVFQTEGTGTIHIDVTDLSEDFDVDRSSAGLAQINRRYDILQRAQKYLTSGSVILYTNLGNGYQCTHEPNTAFVSECFCSNEFGVVCPA